MDVSVILGGIVEQATAVASSPATDEDFRIAATDRAPASEHLPSTVVRFDCDGWVQQVDRRGLLALTEPGSTVRLDTDTGRYAIRGTALCTIWPAVPEDRLDAMCDRARHLVRLGPTRTMSEDPGYGIRQLVDVALRALSPGINDPTTAQDAIFHLGTVLVDRLTSPPAPTAYDGAEGRHLVTPHALTDDNLAELALAELRRAATQPAVAVYLLQMIGLVVDAAAASGNGGRVRGLLEQARLVVATVTAADVLDVDRRQVQWTYDDLFVS
jgi:uncharacterized membrane protein